MTVAPRPSASLCILRDGPAGVEVLMAQRTRTARFMPGAWVFPGGVVDTSDRDALAANAVVGVTQPEHAAWLAAAIRETVEETGIWLSDPPHVVPASDRPMGPAVYERAIAEGRRFAAGDMSYFANWITPADLPIRFDARFYVTAVTDVLDGEADGVEMEDVSWIGPAAAVAAAAVGELELPFPTLKTMEWFATFASTDDLMAWARSLDDVLPTQPRMRVEEGSVTIVLPWDPGYDDLPELSGDEHLLELARTARGVAGAPVTELRSPEAP